MCLLLLWFSQLFLFVNRLGYTVFFNKLVESNNQQLTIMYDIDLCTWSTLKGLPIFCALRFYLQLAPVIHMQSIFTFLFDIGLKSSFIVTFITVMQKNRSIDFCSSTVCTASVLQLWPHDSHVGWENVCIKNRLRVWVSVSWIWA